MLNVIDIIIETIAVYIGDFSLSSIKWFINVYKQSINLNHPLNKHIRLGKNVQKKISKSEAEIKELSGGLNINRGLKMVGFT